jgi:hypothetical protein
MKAVPPGGCLLAVSSSAADPVDYTYFPLLYQKEVARRGQQMVLLSEGFFSTPWYRSTFQREGIPPVLFDLLQQGTDRVPLKKVDLMTFLTREIPRVQQTRPGSGPELGVYEVEGRYFLINRDSLACLMAEGLLPQVSKWRLFFTARFREIERFALPSLSPPGSDKERPTWDWKEVLHGPIVTQGVPGLDGMPIPSGKLFEARIQTLPQ